MMIRYNLTSKLWEVRRSHPCGTCDPWLQLWDEERGEHRSVDDARNEAARIGCCCPEDVEFCGHYGVP